MLDVSVIITNYNNAEYLGRAIRSCLKQTLPKNQYEIIVVDDASTDNSLDIAQDYDVTVIPLTENVGVAEASNTGIRAALGQYIIRVDSDDYINENALLFLSEILKWNHDIGFVYTDHLRVNRREEVMERVNINTPDLLFRHGAGIMFRKSHLEHIGLYDKTLRNAEDYDLLKRYIKNWDGYHLAIPLYRYRRHEGNMTNSEEERKRWEQIADAHRE